MTLSKETVERAVLALLAFAQKHAETQLLSEDDYIHVLVNVLKVPEKVVKPRLM
jgi:hypothetical protein